MSQLAVPLRQPALLLLPRLLPLQNFFPNLLLATLCGKRGVAHSQKFIRNEIVSGTATDKMEQTRRKEARARAK
jgi:hypothetical protein